MPAAEPISVERMEEAERRAWPAIEASTARQRNLDDALAYVANTLARLAESQIKTEERFRDIEEQFRETDARIEKHSRETDARIEKLVIAIGEFMRNGKTKE